MTNIRLIDLDEHDIRLTKLCKWLGGFEYGESARLSRASDDASFRRYFRLQTTSGSFVVMDAPPEHENCEPFVRIAEYLAEMGLNAPRVIEQNKADGFLLLSDLGSTQYLGVVEKEREQIASLYSDALDALLKLQTGGVQFQSMLPPYDEKLLRFELSIFRDWLCDRHLHLTFSDEEAGAWASLCDVLVQSALRQPKVFVHRDFHSRNLMFVERDNPGILDFQDALEGPLTYDLVSLLKDCYFKLPRAARDRFVRAYYEKLSNGIQNDLDVVELQKAFDLMGVQRHLKAAGIFARLKHRDGKSGYLKDIPLTLNYIVELGQTHTELTWIADFISNRCMPALEVSA